MKKHSFITLFIGVHVLFIFMHIHKHMQFIKQSFCKQKNERLRIELVHKKQELINQLYAEKNRADVKQFAQDHGLKSIRLNRVKRVAS